MPVLTLMYYTLLIAVTISLCITVFYFVIGIKTKNYLNAKKSLIAYLILNGARLFMEYFVLK